MLDSPLAYGLLTMVAWGFCSVFATVATDHVSPEVAMVVSCATSAAVALGYVFTRSGAVEYSTRGLGIAAGAGLLADVGAVAFYVGLDRRSTSVVTTVSALYFRVVAIVAIVFLDEAASLQTVAGIGTAGVAVWLLAG